MVQTTTPLNNGDGLNVLYKREISGFRVNTAQLLAEFAQDGQPQYQYRLLPNELPAEFQKLRPGHALNRNLDHNWQQALQKTSAERRVQLDWQLTLDEQCLTATATSEEGVSVTARLDGPFAAASKPQPLDEQLRDLFGQLGTTIYQAAGTRVEAQPGLFVPASALKKLRREAIALLDVAREQARPKGSRKAVSNPPPVYPDTQLSFLANVYNEKARAFYHKYGVQLIDAAFEAHQEQGEVPVMITKHCLRFSFNLCPKQAKGFTGVRNNASDMQLVHDNEVLTLKFDCRPCEMHVVGKIKPHIFNGPPPGSQAEPVRMVGFAQGMH